MKYQNIFNIRWCILLVLVFTGRANATLIGDDIDVSWLFPDASTTIATDNVTVGAGVEIDCPGLSSLCEFFIDPVATIDIGASTIRYDHAVIPFGFSPSAFNGFEFSDLDWMDGPGIITGFNLNTNIAGLDVSRVAFGDDFISINMESLAGGTTGSFFELTLETRHVPEPTILALLSIGLVGLGISRRRMNA